MEAGDMSVSYSEVFFADNQHVFDVTMQRIMADGVAVESVQQVNHGMFRVDGWKQLDSSYNVIQG